MTEQRSEVERYIDKAMYPAAPMASQEPKAYLLWMTPDPLGAVAACVSMYKGRPVYDMAEITDDERRDCWEQVQKTELQMPLEAIKLHFMVEGVSRSLTHQMVRQRTAAYAQESLRFAVKEDLKDSVVVPPSLNDPSISPSKRNDRWAMWEEALEAIQRAYEWMIADGMPAEDAREILPNGTLTRLNYITDLRNFKAEAGKRLCTQAQFHWRQTFMSMREAVRNYAGEFDQLQNRSNSWQFELIADSDIFAPVCYHIGKCGFKAEFDRGCTIRDRVDAFEQAGVAPVLWGSPNVSGVGPRNMQPIRREEWLSDPKAGFVHNTEG